MSLRIVFFIWGMTVLISENFSQNAKKDAVVSYIFPLENMIVNTSKIKLQWVKSPSSDTLSRVQLSESRLFDDLILDTIVTTDYIVIDELIRHKQYYWKVISVQPAKLALNQEAYSFFKTTSVWLANVEQNLGVQIIPTWVNSNEVLVIDNPERKTYSCTIYNANDQIKYQHSGSTEKQAIKTSLWQRGNYLFDLKIEGQDAKLIPFALN